MERRKFNRNAYYSCVGSASGSASVSGSIYSLNFKYDDKVKQSYKRFECRNRDGS